MINSTCLYLLEVTEISFQGYARLHRATLCLLGRNILLFLSFCILNDSSLNPLSHISVTVQYYLKKNF